MSTRRIALLLAAFAGSGGLGACADHAQPRAAVADGTPVEVNYQGRRYLALPRNGAFVIEGDIVVSAADLDADKAQQEPGTIKSALTTTRGIDNKWPDGNVTYSVFNVETGDRQAIVESADWWALQVPGLHFTKLDVACPSTGGNCINVRTDAGGDLSSSSIGRNPGGTQTINIPPGASQGQTLSRGMIAHEFGHAIGAHHEQTRADRAGSVTILWRNISGCPNDAVTEADCGPPKCEMRGTGTPAQNAVANGCCDLASFNAGKCYPYGNYLIPQPQRTLFTYDFDSIMHYANGGFGKSNGSGGFLQTMMPVQQLPPGVSMGQIDHLSTSDVAGMKALYPVLNVSTSLFRNTGVQPLAQLTGREQDINQRFTCAGGGVVAGATVDTSLLVEGSGSLSCTVQSPLWALSYSYPNTTDTTWPASGLETFSKSVTLTVMNAGLIPLLATPA
jgi:astacin (peptidase family M12A)